MKTPEEIKTLYVVRGDGVLKFQARITASSIIPDPDASVSVRRRFDKYKHPFAETAADAAQRGLTSAILHVAKAENELESARGRKLNMEELVRKVERGEGVICQNAQ